MAWVINNKKAPDNGGAMVKDAANQPFPKSPVEVTVNETEIDPNAVAQSGPNTTPANIFRGTRF